MSDRISADLAAAIRAAEAEGKIKVIETAEPRSEKIARRRREVARMHSEGKTPGEIAVALGTSVATISLDRKALGISKPRPGGQDVVGDKKAARAKNGALMVADRRRFKFAAVPMGEAGTLAPKEATGTAFPDRVFTPDGNEAVFKDGCNNSKIGGDVLVGRLKGAYIATLTLEERASCPPTCALWQQCYGNSMPWARRWAHGPELEEHIEFEVEDMCGKHDLVLIRLHVLGDFYSLDYIKLWARLLDTYDNLHVFGFTAWKPNTPLGEAVRTLRKVYPDRFMIRHSNISGRWGSVTIPFPTEEKAIGDIIVCPEQLDMMAGGKDGRHCGNCAACWSCSNPIGFILH